MPSPAYLTPLDATVDVPPKLASALEDIEGQFDLNSDKLKEIVEEMLRSFAQGLRELPNDETRDTFMCVLGPPLSVSSRTAETNRLSFIGP